MKRFVYLLSGLLSMWPLSGFSQQVQHDHLLSFEGSQLPAYVHTENSSASLSGAHFREGKQSLVWNYQPGGVLSIKLPLKFDPKDPTGKDTYLSAFIGWIYSEQAQEKQVEFRFLKEGRLCSRFPFGIHFTGWRGAWVCFERDMEGTPEEGMDEIQVVAPSDASGTLYFDHIIPAAKVDARQQTPDLQIPFVNKGTTNHWLVLYEKSKLRPDIALTPMTEAQRKDIALMEQRFQEQLYTPAVLTEKEMKDIRKRYAYYQIVRDEQGRISGRPVWFVRHSEAYERLISNWDKDLFSKAGVEMSDYFNLMRRVAVAYCNSYRNSADAEKGAASVVGKSAASAYREELKQMFLDLYDNITDQGVAYGSCWGNCHHYGYSMRGMFVSYFLMKNVLLESGRLEDAVKTLRWYAITNEVFPKPTVNGIDIDTFNTKLQGRIASILIMEDSPEKLQYLRSFVRWLEYGCRPATGLSGSFKSDGACFHHCNNYPAYAVGGLDGATAMIFLLSGTEFRLSELAHHTVKQVLLAMRFYCNRHQWPLSMSGRHPNGGGRLIPLQYATMALAGTPDGREPVDGEMAAAYLRLVSQVETDSDDQPDYLPKGSAAQIRQMKQLLEAKGYASEPDPQGNLVLGYGCVAVQRRDQWMAAVRGHSRYLWAAEHYLPANFYGRYLAHGSMQIMTAREGEPITLKSSGWQEAGFDWNRIPGATSIHLPFDQLRARVYNVDIYSGMEEMLYSDEAFAGGLSQAHTNGNFGMKLHEHDKYNGSHRARKSYHFFDGTIVCLGTGIENDNADYPTETTLFQLTVAPEERPLWEKYQGNEQTYIDRNGVGYYLPASALSQVTFERNYPQVTVGERSTRPTQGDWVSLVWNHGKAPKGASYHYAVLPHTDAAELKAFARKPTYRVLRQDNEAHIVTSTACRTTSYVLFESGVELPSGGLLQRADTSCLVMVKEEVDKSVRLSVAQPDLALYRGPSDEAFDEQGKRIERSIYSRPWKDNDSQEIPVTVTLKGAWEVSEGAPCEVLSTTKKQTVLRFRCRDAATYELLLHKK